MTRHPFEQRAKRHIGEGRCPPKFSARRVGKQKEWTKRALCGLGLGGRRAGRESCCLPVLCVALAQYRSDAIDTTNAGVGDLAAGHFGQPRISDASLSGYLLPMPLSLGQFGHDEIVIRLHSAARIAQLCNHVKHDYAEA